MRVSILFPMDDPPLGEIIPVPGPQILSTRVDEELKTCSNHQTLVPIAPKNFVYPARGHRRQNSKNLFFSL